jgi:hypothetical protein
MSMDCRVCRWEDDYSPGCAIASRLTMAMTSARAVCSSSDSSLSSLVGFVHK